MRNVSWLRHVDKRHHLVMDMAAEKSIHMKKSLSLEMFAEFLTKAMKPSKLKTAVRTFKLFKQKISFKAFRKTYNNNNNNKGDNERGVDLFNLTKRCELLDMFSL